MRVEQMDAARIRRIVAVTVTGAFPCAREAVHRNVDAAGRQGRRHTAAAAILWLLSPEVSCTTRAILDVTGGR
jgi:NAD(P)-dependent dehydrogenase (short-subunit alcohol dehydrogenase family)